MTATIDITAEQRKTLLALLRRFIPGVAVWAYGSRVKWTARPNSDLDLVAFTTPNQRSQVSELKEALDESDLPFLVDLHVWGEVPEKFREIIRKEYVVLQVAGQVEDSRVAGDVRPFGKLFAEPTRNGLTRPKAVRGSGIKMVNMGELFAYPRLRNVPMDRVPLNDSEAERFLLADGDLLFARQSLVLEGAGKCSIFLEDSEPVTFESHITRVRLDPDTGDPRYYFYYLQSHHGRAAIRSIVEQGAGASGIRGSDLQALSVQWRPINEQRAIAHILGTLDDKIELNRRMNETLEAMARALFKSWFVDFDPVRAKMSASPHPKSLSRGERDFTLPSPGGRGAGGEGTTPTLRPHAAIPAELLDFARELRRQATDAETLLWRLLRGRQLANAKFRRQHSFPPYILDFYCHELKLAVELDGGQHNEEAGRGRDIRRDEYLAGHGIRVLRFWNNDVLSQTEAVLEAIYAAVVGQSGGVPSPPAPLPVGEGSHGLPQPLANLFPDSFEDSELGEIPKGWQCSTVGKHFKLTMGQSPPGSTYNEFGDGLPFFQGRTDFGFRFPSRRVFCTAPTRLAEAGDTLVSVRAPVGDVNIAIEPCAIGRGVAAVRHLGGSCSFTYHAMHNLGEHFDKFEAEGTVFGSINKADFERLPFVAPPSAVLARFEQLVSSIDDRVESNERESRTLAALRDTLLPKLISGELRVKDAERVVEAGLS